MNLDPSGGARGVVQSGPAVLETLFLGVPLAVLGLHGRCSIGPTVCGTLRKMFTKPFSQPAGPDLVATGYCGV